MRRRRPAGASTIDSVPETAGVDLRIYVTDARRVAADFGWRPTRGPARIVRDIRAWIEEHREALTGRPGLAPATGGDAP